MPKGQHGDDDAQRQDGKRFDYSITLIWWDSEAMTTATKCEQSTQRAAAKKRKERGKGRREKDAAGEGGKKNQRGQALEAVKREIYFEQAL